jgi:DNA-binding MarR family transcriptional regulator
MTADMIDALQSDWSEQRPDLDSERMAVVLRIQALARILGNQAEASLDHHGLQWWQYDVLSALRRQGEPHTMSSSELADAGMLTSGAMTNRIDRLEEEGLVSREGDPQDRRRILIRLTQHGLERVERAIEARFNTADAALDSLTAAKRDTLNGLLRELLLANQQ